MLPNEHFASAAEKDNKQMMPDTESSLSWRAPDFEYREKTASWYWASMVIALLLLAAAIWQKNFFFALFIVIAEVLVLVWAERSPEEYTFVADAKGLQIGEKKFYAWREIESFSVLETASDLVPVALRFKQKFKPLLKILVPRAHVEELEQLLTSLVPQVDGEHSLVDILGDFLGF